MLGRNIPYRTKPLRGSAFPSRFSYSDQIVELLTLYWSRWRFRSMAIKRTPPFSAGLVPAFSVGGVRLIRYSFSGLLPGSKVLK